MGPTLGRYLAVRAALGSAVAGLVALPAAAAPPLVPLLLLAWITASSLAGYLIYRRCLSGRSVLLGVLLAVDLAVEAALVAATGISRSPFVLLFTLTIAAGGLFYGVVGGVVMALGATICYWGVILRLGQPLGVAPVLSTLLLLVLGLLFGRLGRRMAWQSVEMNRVKRELERVQLDAETIVASLSGPLLCLDRTGGVRRINQAAASLLGLQGHLVGARLAEMGASERVAPLMDFVKQAFQGAACSAEIELPHPDGKPATPVEVSASCVRDRGGVGTAADLSLQDDGTEAVSLRAAASSFSPGRMVGDTGRDAVLACGGGVRGVRAGDDQAAVIGDDDFGNDEQVSEGRP